MKPPDTGLLQGVPDGASLKSLAHRNQGAELQMFRRHPLRQGCNGTITQMPRLSGTNRKRSAAAPHRGPYIRLRKGAPHAASQS